MVHAEGAVYPPSMVLRSDGLWISLCSACANHRGRSGRSGSEDDHSLANDNLVTWRDAVDHILRRWGHVRTQRIALSTRGEGIETAGGARGVVHRLQSRSNSEAGKRSMISTRRLCHFFQPEVNISWGSAE